MKSEADSRRPLHIVGLADCNNFFVSCERTVDPSLMGRAVVVLSNNDGCVVARSNEAKLLGVKMGQPCFEIKSRIKSGEIIALSGNHLLYREISLKVHDIFRRFVPSTLDYSVDESFLDVTGIDPDWLPDIGRAICSCCLTEAGIPVTIGFAPSKTLAKIAAEAGKKSGSPVMVLPDLQGFEPYMAKLPIGELWGIGRRLSKRLYVSGIHTIADFAAAPLMWVRKNLGVNGEKSWRELHGESCIELSHIGAPLQDSISETRTFPEDIDDFDYLRSRIAIYCAHITKRLRAMKGCCQSLTVFLRTNRFHTEHGYYAPEASVKFSRPVCDQPTVTAAAIGVLEQIFDPRLKYKRAGVVLHHITPEDFPQPSVFDDVELDLRQRSLSSSLMLTVDSINHGVGPQVVKLASQLTAGRRGHNDGYSSSFGPPK